MDFAIYLVVILRPFCLFCSLILEVDVVELFVFFSFYLRVLRAWLLRTHLASLAGGSLEFEDSVFPC